jgi:hypothetical protein
LDGSAKVKQVSILQNKGTVQLAGCQLGLESDDALMYFLAGLGMHYFDFILFSLMAPSGFFSVFSQAGVYTRSWVCRK